MITEVNDSNYEMIVSNSKKPVMLDFTAQWCSSCKALHPTLSQLSDEYTNEINIVRIDVDDNPILTSKFQIKNLPTILFMKDDKIVDKQVGTTTKSKLVEKLNKMNNK